MGHATMAVGKNKRLTKGGKKGSKKKAGDPFLKKEWYDVKAPAPFTERNCCKTLITKSAGTKIASEGLKGRVFELNLADLNKGDDDQAHKKVKLCVEEVENRNCLTDFHALSLTRDKLASLVRKFHSLIEANVDVKTTDGYLVRMFCQAFTDKVDNQVKNLCYVQTAQAKKIRKRMVQHMTQEVSKVDLRDLVKKLIAESIGKEIEKSCKSIFPVRDVLIRKVKILKKPKFDIVKLKEAHQDSGLDAGAALGRPEAEEAKNLLAAEEEDA